MTPLPPVNRFWVKNFLAKADVRCFRTTYKYIDLENFIDFRMISDNCRSNETGTNLQSSSAEVAGIFIPCSTRIY